MASHLAALFKKELRVTFRDPQVIVGTILIPVLLFPLMGSAIKVGEQATLEQLAQVDVAFLSLDGLDGNDTETGAFFAVLSASNITLHNVSDASLTTPEAAVPWTLDHGYGTLVALPANFTEEIESGHAATVKVFAVLRNFGPAETGGADRVANAVASFDAAMAAQRAAASFPNSTAAEKLYPARIHTESVIRGQVRNLPPDLVLNTVLGSSLTLPLVISIMIMVSAGLAATSVASEKEEKTLEVLLTLPTRREFILLGKLAGVFVVAVIGTLAVFIGFTYYTASVTGSLPTADAAQAGLEPDTQGYVLLLLTLLLSFVAALCLAVLVAAYAKDTKGAQSLMSVLYVPVFLPAIIMSFTPIQILPPAFQGAIYAIPFSYPSLAGKALYTHEYGGIYLGIVYQVAFMILVLYLAARMFSTEKVLTARLSFGKRKRKLPAEE